MNIVTCREKQHLLPCPRALPKAAFSVYFVQLKSLYPEAFWWRWGWKVTVFKVQSSGWYLLGVSLTQNLPLE